MDAIPTRKYGGDLRDLKRAAVKDIIPGKFYYIRMRNKDVSADSWGAKEDFIGRINVVDATGISFDAAFSRYGDPRHGKPVWKKTDSRVLLLRESLVKKNMEDNTTFYTPADMNSPARKTRKATAFQRLANVLRA
jgi:hypothetical protein